MSACCSLPRLLASVSVSTQSAPASAETTRSYSPPKTPWGDPDLQGIWPGTDMVGVPFERPERFGTRLYLTDAELKEREQQAAKQQELDVLDFDLQKPPAEIVALGDVGGVTSPPPHWLERGVPSRQSSLIVQPANGRMPQMTPEGDGAAEVGGRHLRQADGLCERFRAGPVRSLHLARRRRIDDAGRLQQRKRDRAEPRGSSPSATR